MKCTNYLIFVLKASGVYKLMQQTILNAELINPHSRLSNSVNKAIISDHRTTVSTIS